MVSVGDDGWTSCIDWPELSVAVVSDHFISDSVVSAMAPSTVCRKPESVLFCSVLFCPVLFCSVLFCSALFCFVLTTAIKVKVDVVSSVVLLDKRKG